MSYILDALRRADAERERGAVPSLSSQQHAYVEDDAAKAQRPRALLWAVIVLAVALVVAVAWNSIGGAPSAPRPVVEGAVSPPPTTPVPLPTAPVAPAPAAAIAPPATTMASPAVTEPPAPATAPPPTHKAAAKQAPEPKRVARRNGETDETRSTTASTSNATTANVAAAKAAPAQPAEQKAARAGDGRVYQQSELPEDVRRDLPKLVIGGASYSGDAASRMVMINGQIFHEGDQLSPQLVLERIKLKSAVLSYKGYRYEVTF